MTSFTQRIKRWLKPNNLTHKKAAHRARLSVERLEEREVMDVAISGLITEMTDLANLYPTKSTPTMLFLNFDGLNPTDRSTAPTVSAFTGTEQDKQEILFRTSEIFAPFNEIGRAHV